MSHIPSGKSPPRRPTPQSIVAAYVIVASLWIFLSDTGLTLYTDTEVLSWLLQVVKGLSFVGVTGLLLHILIRRAMTILWSSEKELYRANRAFRVLSDCNQKLLRAQTEEALLCDVCKVTVEVGSYSMAWIGFKEHDEARTVRLMASAGGSEETLRAVRVTWDESETGRGAIGTAIRTGQPAIIRNTLDDPDYAHWREEAARSGYRAVVGLPIIIEGEAIGALGVYATEPDAFDPGEVKLLEELAGDVAYGLAALRTRQANQQAKKQIEHLASFPELHPNPVVEVTFDGEITYYNPAAANRLSSLGLADASSFLPPDLPELLNAMRQSPQISVYREVLVKDRIYGERINAVPLQERIRFYIDDITERRRAENELLDSEERFRSLFEQAPIGISLSRDLKILYTNPAYARMFGFAEKSDLAGAPILDLLAVQHHHAVAERTQRRESGGLTPVNYELMGVRRSGEQFPIYLDVIRIDLKDGPASLGFVLDITERKRAENALRESEEMFRQLAETIREVFWVRDVASDRYIYISPAHESLWGRSRQELLDDPRAFMENIHPEDVERVKTEMQQQEGNRLVDLEYRIVRPDGTIRWVWSRTFPVQDANGVIYRRVGLAEDITERKQAERALYESEERFRSAFQDAGIGMVMTRIEGEFEQVNRACCDMLGYSEAELLSMNWQAVTHPDDVEKSNELISSLLGSGSPRRIEKRYIHKDGHTIWALINSSVLYDGEGNPTHFITQVQDITERKQAEGALRDSEARFRSAFEHANIGMALVALDGRYLEVNRAMADILGYDEAELLAVDWQTLTFPEDSEKSLEQMRRLLNGDIPYCRFEKRYVHKQGRTVWTLLNSSLVRSVEGKSLYFVTQVQDITERKQAESALRQSEARFRSAFEHAGIGMSLTRPDGTFAQVNRAFCDMLGYTEAELLSLDWPTLTHPEDVPKTDEQVQRLLSGEDSYYQLEKRYIHKQGQIIWALINSSLLRDAEGKPIHFITQLQDITERKQAERALRESEERFRTAFEYAGVGMSMTRPDRSFVQINRSLCDMLGYSKDELMTLGWQAITHPDDLQKNIDLIEDILNGRSPGPGWLEKRYIHKDGHIIWALLTTSLIRDSEGAPLHFLSQQQDITERKLAEHALQESEARFRGAFESAGVGTALVRLDGHFMEVNHAFCDMLGYTEAELVALSWPAITHPEDLSDSVAKVKQLLDGEVPFIYLEKRYLHKQGHVVWGQVSSSLIRDTEGKPLCTIAHIQNITKRRRAEEAEREQRALAEAMRDSAATIVGALSFEEVLHHILENVRAAVPNTAAALLLIDDDKVRPAAWLGYEDNILEKYESAPLSLDTPNLLQMRTTGRFCLIPDTAEYLGWAKLPGQEWIRSYVGVPIRVHDQIIGFLSLDSATPGFFTSAHAERLEAFADQAAVAVYNAQLYEEVRAHAAELERHNHDLMALHEMGQTLTTTLDVQQISRAMYREIGKRILNAPHFMLALYDEETQLITCGYAVVNEEELDPATLPVFPLGEGPNSEAIRTRQVQIIDPRPIVEDLHSKGRLVMIGEGDAPRSAIYVPLISGDHVVGVINVQSFEPNAFHEADITLLSILANQAAAALQNARLFEQTQRHAEELQRRVDERTAELLGILDAMGEGLIYSDLSQVRYINEAFWQMTGYGVGNIVEHNGRRQPVLLDHVVNGEAVVGDIVQALDRGDVWRGELKVRRRDGSAFDSGVTITAVTRPDGENIGNVALIRDISQVKALQAQRERFIANAAHELGTPVTNMKLHLYLARRQPEKLNEHLGVLEIVADRMKSLVEDLLALSRFERGKITLAREYVVLQKLLHEVVTVQQPHAQNKGIALTLNLPDQPLRVYVDANRLTQVITNLVVNATNYTPENGSISVELEMWQNNALIHVRDTGIGIAPEMQARIFEPFFRVNETGVPGTGLGLAISNEIVELHGGKLTVESQIGRGSVFTICLPL